MMRVLLAGLLFGATALAAAPREVTLYFTANLGGRFPLDNNLDDNHLLRIGSYLRAARVKNPASYHIDLGNAFYPGRLSRYSFGSLTADYLQTLRVDAGLVAAGDLNIGAESLDYIRRARGIRLISANIFRDQNPFFEEFALVDKGGVKTAVIGLTSTRSLLDYAETQMLDLRFEAGEAPLQRALEKARREKPDLSVAVTGLSLEEGVRVLGQNPGIDLLVCGGDSESKVGSEGVRLVELGDGRKIIAMPP